MRIACTCWANCGVTTERPRYSARTANVTNAAFFRSLKSNIIVEYRVTYWQLTNVNNRWDARLGVRNMKNRWDARLTITRSVGVGLGLGSGLGLNVGVRVRCRLRRLREV